MTTHSDDGVCSFEWGCKASLRSDLSQQRNVCMNSSQDYLDEVTAENPDIVFYPEYTPALLGLSYMFGEEPRLVYDYDGVIAIIMKDSDMTMDEALDYFEFNVMGTYAGKATPCFMKRRLPEGVPGSTLAFY